MCWTAQLPHRSPADRGQEGLYDFLSMLCLHRNHMGHYHHVFMSLKASATQRLGWLAVSAGVIMEKPSMHEGKPNHSFQSLLYNMIQAVHLCQKVKAWFVSE